MTALGASSVCMFGGTTGQNTPGQWDTGGWRNDLYCFDREENDFIEFSSNDCSDQNKPACQSSAILMSDANGDLILLGRSNYGDTTGNEFELWRFSVGARTWTHLMSNNAMCRSAAVALEGAREIIVFGCRHDPVIRQIDVMASPVVIREVYETTCPDSDYGSSLLCRYAWQHGVARVGDTIFIRGSSYYLGSDFHSQTELWSFNTTTNVLAFVTAESPAVSSEVLGLKLSPMFSLQGRLILLGESYTNPNWGEVVWVWDLTTKQWTCETVIGGTVHPTGYGQGYAQTTCGVGVYGDYSTSGYGNVLSELILSGSDTSGCAKTIDSNEPETRVVAAEWAFADTLTHAVDILGALICLGFEGGIVRCYRAPEAAEGTPPGDPLARFRGGPREPVSEITLAPVDGHALYVANIGLHASGDYLTAIATYKRRSSRHNPDSTVVSTIGIGADDRLSLLGTTSLSYAAGAGGGADFLTDSDQVVLSSCVCTDNTGGGGVVTCDLSDRQSPECDTLVGGHVSVLKNAEQLAPGAGDASTAVAAWNSGAALVTTAGETTLAVPPTAGRGANGVAAIPGTALYAIVENQNTSPRTLASVLRVANLLTGEVIGEVELGSRVAARHVQVINGYAWVSMSDGAYEPGTGAGGLALVDLRDPAHQVLIDDGRLVYAAEPAESAMTYTLEAFDFGDGEAGVAAPDIGGSTLRFFAVVQATAICSVDFREDSVHDTCSNVLQGDGIRTPGVGLSTGDDMHNGAKLVGVEFPTGEATVEIVFILPGDQRTGDDYLVSLLTDYEGCSYIPAGTSIALYGVGINSGVQSFESEQIQVCRRTGLSREAGSAEQIGCFYIDLANYIAGSGDVQINLVVTWAAGATRAWLNGQLAHEGGCGEFPLGEPFPGTGYPASTLPLQVGSWTQSRPGCGYSGTGGASHIDVIILEVGIWALNVQ
jgi:hypothetical protein